MKRMLMMVAVSCFACALSTSHAAEFRGETGITFDWWGDNRDNDATQLLVPVRLQGRVDDFSVTLLTAYADTSISGQEKSSLSAMLDTKLIATYELIGKLPFDLVLGLDLNLPTGTTNLRQGQLALIMDPDLISINNYGEGVDVNLTLAVAQEWGNWVGGIGFGYLWRGEYDFSTDLNLTEYQPGDIFNINGELRYYFSPDLHLRLFAREAWYGTDTVRGADFYEQGDFTLLGLGLAGGKTKSWDGSITFQGILRGKSHYRGSPGAFAFEPYDSYGDEVHCDILFRYLLDETTAIRSLLQGRYYLENEFSSDPSLYIGARDMLSLGIGVTRSFTPQLEAALDVRGTFRHDDPSFAPDIRSAGVPVSQRSRDSQGVSVMMRVAGSF